MKKRLIVLASFAALSLSGAVFGDFQIFTDPGAFFQALEAKGKISKGFWDFKPNNVGKGFIAAIDDPLNFITAPGTGIWDNMPLDNIQFQSNLNPQGEGGPNPRGAGGLAFATAPFFGIKNNILVANIFVDSFDILSGVPEPDNHTAMAMNVVSLASGGGDVHITVWDKNEQHKTKLVLPGPWQDNEKRFVGILAQDERTIGRVNIYDLSNGAEGISAIEVFLLGEPNDCPWDLSDDGDVGIPDLLILLAEWGNPYGVPDLLRLLAAWGPCPGGNVCEAGEVCNEFGGPCGSGAGGDFDLCFCFTTDPAGGGTCVANFFCGGLETCPDGDCPPGFVCIYDSCCGETVCAPDISCPNPPPLSSGPSGPSPFTTGSGLTGSGQFIEASQSAPTRRRDVWTTQGSDSLSGMP